MTDRVLTVLVGFSMAVIFGMEWVERGFLVGTLAATAGLLLIVCGVLMTRHAPVPEWFRLLFLLALAIFVGEVIW